MKTLKIVFLTFFLLITMGITGGVTPLHSQSFNVISGDTIKYKTDLKAQYRYTYVYLNQADSVGKNVTDSLQFFTYHPITKNWIAARMIDLTNNIDIAPSVSIPVTLATPKVLAFYELYLYGWKIVKVNGTRNAGNTLIYIKNVGGTY